MISHEDKEAFFFLIVAAQEEKLVMIECKDKKTGEMRAAICIYVEDEEGVATIRPIGHLAPMEDYEPPGDDEEVKAWRPCVSHTGLEIMEPEGSA